MVEETIMPRIKHRTTAIFLVLFIISTLLYYLVLQQNHFESTRLLSTQAILEALGPRNSSAAQFVLPEESTILLRPAKTCEEGGEKIFALFLVNSAPENRERRDAIRNGWSSVLNSNMDPGDGYNIVLFFTGIRDNEEIPLELEEEWKDQGDIIVEDLVDTYFNLTLKVLRMFKWKQSHCPRANFLVKIDDDVHLNALKFIKQLKSYTGSDARTLIAGHMYNGTSVIRDPYSKWFVPYELYSPSTSPKFVSGICYILGVDAVPKLYQATLSQPLFHLEDVFLTGMIASDTLHMKLSHIPTYAVYWTPLNSLGTTLCTFAENYIAVHSASVENLHCWNQVNNKDFVCDFWPMFLHC